MESKLSDYTTIELEARLQRLSVDYNDRLHKSDTEEHNKLLQEIKDLREELRQRADSHFKHNENS